MKRSEINKAIRDMEALIARFNFALPPFCCWSPDDWQDKGHEYDEIRDNMLGWDVTDYGEGRFREIGFSLITLRNGNRQMPEKYEKSYAEKLLMIYENQTSPMHFHHYKMEDIINRGGGNLLIKVYNSTEDGKYADTDVKINQDGREYMVPAGSDIRLMPGESITIYRGLYHAFAVEKSTGDVLIGEVSMCNDDNAVNHFHDELGRFPDLEEDEPAYRLLCNEYPQADAHAC